MEPHIRSIKMRMSVLLLLLAGVAAKVTPADAAERIFADGFEPCCTLGGEVSGLTNNGLVLHLAAGAISENKAVSANGGLRLYTFSNTTPPGTAYTVTITTQPTSQTCTVSNASGTMAGTPATDINATCVAGPANLVWDDGAWDDADWQ